MNTTTPFPNPTSANNQRAAWMGLLARARPVELAALIATAPPLPEFTRLRGPETGLVMLRGRTGGGGAPFNLGAMSATRASIRDAGGRIGHATVAGRDGAHAEAAARLDAALQDPVRHAGLKAAILDKLAASEAARHDARARRAAATRVDFFALAAQRASTGAS
jgi:alpha-D-ribose 1-methylphosphonate 5-triphosphate synthase subunit PhnG